MKKYSLLFLLTSFLGMGLFTACEEETTLDGAKEVYITIDPASYYLSLGDTLKISAKVTNLSGKVIDTPISWSLTDEGIAQILGDTALVAVDGGQGKETKLKAELENGKYALAAVTIARNLADGVMCIPNDSTFTEITSKRSYNTPHDSVMFLVRPKELLYDYEPQITLEGLDAFDPLTTINYEKGLVVAHYKAPRASGEGKVTLTIGDESTAKSASCAIKLAPELLATFYGEGFETMPYLDRRPDKSTLSMYFAYTNEKTIDINSDKTVQVAINLQSGAEEDIENAKTCYEWKAVSGSAVVIKENKIVDFENQGFDAVLTVQSGLEEGTAEFHCITPDTVFVATFIVKDFKKRYPVDEITVDVESIEIPVGGNKTITVGVIPESSFAFHKPVITASNPDLVEIGEYDGNLITIKGVEMGEGELIFQANGKEKRIPVKITEGIKTVIWEQGNARALFEGETIQWGVDVRTTSGSESPYPVNWTSSDTNVLTAAQVEGDNKHGVLTGLAQGTSVVTAEVLGATSEPATVKVIALPENLELTTDLIDVDGSAIYPDGNDLTVVLTPTEGQKYGSIILTVKDGGANEMEGTHTIGEGSIVEVDGAKAAVTGTLDVTMTESGANITFNIQGQVGDRTLSMTANGVNVFYNPEEVYR